jgi:hypothetical protein
MLNKKEVMKNLPSDPDDKILSVEEFDKIRQNVKIILRDVSTCYKCHGNGCDYCNHVGLYSPFKYNGKWYNRNPDVRNYGSSGKMRIDYNLTSDIHINVRSIRNSCVDIYIPFSNVQGIILNLVKMAAVPGMNTYSQDIDVVTKISGPSIMSIAGTKKSNTVTVLPSKTQQEAINLLRKNGFDDEALLMEEAIRHESFQINEENYKKFSSVFNDDENKNILKRKGNLAKVNDVIVEVDEMISATKALR